MWLISEPYEGSAPNNSVIAAEVMIWTYSTDGHFSPAGRKLKEIAIDDTTWEVWHQKDWDDKSGVNKNKWVNVSFRAKNSSMKSSIPALELLLYAIRDGLIAQNLYVADVELGNEVMNGSGIAWVKEFDVLYEKRF